MFQRCDTERFSSVHRRNVFWDTKICCMFVGGLDYVGMFRNTWLCAGVVQWLKTPVETADS